MRVSESRTCSIQTIELSHERERSHDPACVENFLEEWTKIRVFHDAGQMIRKI